jgi:transposase-like protein
MELRQMDKLFTKEQARNFLRKNNLKDAKSIEDAFVAQFKDVIQEALEEELSYELGYSKYDWKNKEGENSRNGHTKKTVKSSHGDLDLRIPRDCAGEFEPVIVKKHERRLTGSLEDRIIGLYAKGMSNRDIYDSMQDLYGIEVSAEMVTRITDKILPVAREWQNRPLEPIYPILYLDGMVFPVQQDGQVIKKTVYLVFGVTLEGHKEVLGIWIGEAESAKFWMKVLTDLKNRGVSDVLIASVDGLKGFKEAIEALFPQAEIQQCVIHQIRNSCKYVSYKDLKAFCADMKAIYTAPNEEAGLAALARFEEAWGGKYGYAIKSWRTNWPNLATFFKYPEEIRRIIYTTNTIENLNRRMRKVTKNKSSFPTDDALFKLLYLAVMDAAKKWTTALRDWSAIINQLRIYYGERIDNYL